MTGAPRWPFQDAYDILGVPSRSLFTANRSLLTAHPQELPMGMMQEFKAFALRGNMVDLAVGIVIGGAFSGLVKSLVDDVMMPPLGLLIGGVDFSNIAITLRAAVGESPAVVLRIGAFVNTMVNFTIMALAVFLVVRMMNRMSGTPVPADKA